MELKVRKTFADEGAKKARFGSTRHYTQQTKEKINMQGLAGNVTETNKQHNLKTTGSSYQLLKVIDRSL